MSRSPLSKRFPRELRNNLGKYLGMFLLLAIAISVTSGFLGAASSITKIIDGMRDKYTMEDAYFTTEFEISRQGRADVEALGATVYDSFYSDVPAVVENGPDAGNFANPNVTVRLYPNRTEVNLPDYCEGRAPEADDEIALERVFCGNHDLHVGDVISLDGRSFTICGIMTMPDYSALFAENSGLIMNAITFTVSQVTDAAYDEVSENRDVFRYSVLFDDRELSLVERTSLEEDVLEAISDSGALLTDFADYESNQGSHYAPDDVSGDSMMWTVLLIILIVIMAFVFVVLTDATIDAESSVIGTLLASGYRKGELIRHYMALPMVVGVVAAAIGAVVGATTMTIPMQELYYNSYGFPPFVYSFDPAVFAKTTLLPLALLFAITLFGLLRKMRCTPLQFLRHETGDGRTRKGLRLPESMSFTSRFRLRVLVRNLSHFVTLFFGIMFGSILLLFGVCLLPVVEDYAQELAKDIVAQHLYVMKAPVELEGTTAQRDAYAAAEKLATTKDLASIDPVELVDLYLLASTIDEDANFVNTEENAPEVIAQAEKFASTTLDLPRKIGGAPEEITIYGIQENSRYWDGVDVAGGKVAVGKGVIQKCGGGVGSVYKLSNRYSGDAYELTPDVETGSETTMYIYMSLDAFNELFDNDPGYFNGYASDEPLNLNGRYVATELTPNKMVEITQQMSDSMSSIAGMMLYIAIPIYLVLMYLLTKTVIDRSARPISYMKVFGYRDREVSRLYVRSITMAVLVSLVVSLPLVIWSIGGLVTFMMSAYSGNLPIHIPLSMMAEVVAVGAVTYAVVAVLHVRRIRKIPLALAMKAQE